MLSTNPDMRVWDIKSAKQLYMKMSVDAIECIECTFKLFNLIFDAEFYSEKFQHF